MCTRVHVLSASMLQLYGDTLQCKVCEAWKLTCMPLAVDLHCSVMDDVNEVESTGPSVVLAWIDDGFTKPWLAWWRTDLATIVSAAQQLPLRLGFKKLDSVLGSFGQTRHRNL